MRHFQKHIGLRIFLLVLFLGYMADISFFTHTHVVQGVTVVHSHYLFKHKATDSADTPESKRDAGQHTHTNQSLVLIAQTAHWTATLPTLPNISENFSIQNVCYLIKEFHSPEQFTPSYFHLRSPPFQG